MYFHPQNCEQNGVPRPSSPKFGLNNNNYSNHNNSYGLRSPQHQKSRQVLLDQIINNCQRAQSPISKKRHTHSKANSFNGFGCSKNNSGCQQNSYIRIEGQQHQNKQNVRHSSKSQQRDRNKASMNKEKSYESSGLLKNNNQSSYQMSIDRGSINNSNFVNCGQEQKLREEYFPAHIPRHLGNSPTYKFKTLTDFPKTSRQEMLKIPKPEIRQRQKQRQKSKQKEKSQQQAYRKQLEQERQHHIDHCRKQERKLRLYYIQLQNKLCEMRNKQLKILAQYESQKLRQFDQCLKDLQNKSTPEFSANANTNTNIVRVSQNIQPQISGCLQYSGLDNGVCFSFDQTKFDNVCL